MRQFLAVLSALILAVGLVGCDSSDNDSPTAEVRFMHASAGAGPVDILVGGEEVAGNVEFSSATTNPTVSSYFDIDVGSSTDIEVQDANGNTVISTDVSSANLEEGNDYTIIVAGAATISNSPQAIVLRDQFRDDLANDQVGIRLVHGSAGAGTVDIYLTPPGTSLGSASPLVEDFMFTGDFPGGFPGQFAPQTVTSDGSVLSVTPANSTTAVLQLDVGTGDQGSLDVQPGQHITGVAIDDPSTQSGAGALVLVDTPNSN